MPHPKALQFNWDPNPWDEDGLVNGVDIFVPNIMDYALLWANACSTMAEADESRTNPNARLPKCTVGPRTKNIVMVTTGAVSGNAEDALDLGVRLATGCTTKKDDWEAMEWWLRITGLEAVVTAGYTPTPGFFLLPNVPRPIKARAFSCLAGREIEHCTTNNGKILNSSCLYKAGKFADECAALGLVTPTIMGVASRIETYGFREPVNQRYPEHDTTRFRQLTHLWEAHDNFDRNVEQRLAKLASKQGQNPSAYRCAASGCGIESTTKSALKSCAGPCARDIKPSYCSKECQRKDWKRHKFVCKPNAVADPQSEAPSDGASIQSPGAEGSASGWATESRKEHYVSVPHPADPSKTMHLASTGLSPSELRRMRDVMMGKSKGKDPAVHDALEG